MLSEESRTDECLNHLGIVAGVCQDIALAARLYTQDLSSHRHVSVRTATVAMVLNVLGINNRKLYLVSQFFAIKHSECVLYI